MAKNIISLKRPGVLFAIFFVFSAFLCAKGLYIVAAICALAAVLAAAVFLFVAKNKFSIFCFLLACCLICPVFHLLLGSRRAEKMLSDTDNENTTKMHAIVEDKSVYYNKTVLYVSLLQSGKNATDAKAVVVYNKIIPCEVYDEIEFSGISFSYLNKSQVMQFTGGFPSKEKALSEGCYIGVCANELTRLGRIESGKRNIVHNYYYYIKDNLQTVFSSFGGVDTFSYAMALLTGDRSHFSQSVFDVFTRSGLIAILCISGLHVVITSAFIEFFLKKLHFSKKLQAIAMIFFLLFIMTITGFRGSVVRATIMSMCFYFSELSGRHYDNFSVLAVSFIAISVANPFCIFDTSTLLSYLAMTGLVFAGTSRDSYFNNTSTLFYKLKNTINASVYAQTFAAIPVVTMFGGISIISPISNLAASFFFPILMYFLVLCAFLCFLPTPLLSILAFVPKVFIYLLDLCAKVFASVPFSYASFHIPPFSIYMFVAMFLIFLLSCVFLEKKFIVYSGFCNLIVTLSVVISLFALSFFI